MRHSIETRDFVGIGLLILLAAGRLSHSQALTGGSTTPPQTIYLSPGAAFANNRAANIDGLGKVGAVQGSPTDCVLVDGTSTACSGSIGTGNFAGNEVPSKSSTLVYTLVHTPNPAALLQLFLNGSMLTQGVDYSISGTTITFISYYAASFNGSDSNDGAPALVAFYQY